MGKRRRETPAEVRRRRLDAIYAKLPRLECLGACRDSCGSVPMTDTEQRRTAEAGTRVPNPLAGEPLRRVCPALTMFGRCGVYEVRPMLCRLWGVAESLACPWGCRPEGGLMPDGEAYELLAQVFEVDGHHDIAADMRLPYSTPERAALARRMLAERRRRDDDEYARIERRAAADGSLVYLGAVGFRRPRKSDGTNG